MSFQILLVLILTIIINIITTLSYSVRIVGIRTGRIAISFSLFNIMVLVSRTANSFQAPLLAKTVENDIKSGILSNVDPFRYIILSCTIGTIIGAFLIPTFQRLLVRAVDNFSIHKSIPKLIFHSFSTAGVEHFKESIRAPSLESITRLSFKDHFPWKIFLLNIAAVAILTIGVLSAVYAAYINPDYRTTASNLSAFINGFATILMFTFIDPDLSIMTDEVVLGRTTEAVFRRYIVYMVIARVIGTLIAQILFLPGARALAAIAELM